MRKLPEPEEITEELKTRCTCNEYEWTEHTCPYSEDVNGDYETKCNCCPCCTQECALDI